MPQMPPQQHQRMKILSAFLILIAAALVAGFLYFYKNPLALQKKPESLPDTSNEPMEVVVEENRTESGALVVPPGLPQDIPLEKGDILESTTTKFLGPGAEQLSLTYTSSKSVAQKYAEYKTYMSHKGYEIMEGPANSQVRSVFGTSAAANLSVAISSTKDGTLVQISYLIK